MLNMYRSSTVKTTLIALLCPWIRASAILYPKGAYLANNQTELGTYSIAVVNNCKSPDDQTYLHFFSPFGSIYSTQRESEAPRKHTDGSNTTVTFAMARDETMTFDFVLSNLQQKAQSSWRLWWDAAEGSKGSRNQTLLEVTCEANMADLADNISRCWIDVSNVDGLTNSLQVDFFEAEFPSITARPPKDWRCPEPNRYPVSQHSHDVFSFLAPNQACVSNCSLLNTDEACCRNAHNARETCSKDPSPGIKEAAQEAYSFAYDDHTPFKKGDLTVTPIRKHNFPSGTNIFHATLCF